MIFKSIKKFNFKTILYSTVINVLLIIFCYDASSFAYGFPFPVVQFTFIHNVVDTGYKTIFQMLFTSYQNISLFILNFLVNVGLICLVVNIFHNAYLKVTSKAK